LRHQARTTKRRGEFHRLAVAVRIECVAREADPQLAAEVAKEMRVRAAVWHNRRDIRIEEIQSPPLPPRGQVQVKVSWCGICGTDLHEYLDDGPIYIPVTRPHPLTGVQAPVVVGHEMSGEVVEVGEYVEDFAPSGRGGCGETWPRYDR
jgi:hypothetical protein